MNTKQQNSGGCAFSALYKLVMVVQEPDRTLTDRNGGHWNKGLHIWDVCINMPRKQNYWMPAIVGSSWK